MGVLAEEVVLAFLTSFASFAVPRDNHRMFTIENSSHLGDDAPVVLTCPRAGYTSSESSCQAVADVALAEIGIFNAKVNALAELAGVAYRLDDATVFGTGTVSVLAAIDEVTRTIPDKYYSADAKIAFEATKYAGPFSGVDMVIGDLDNVSAWVDGMSNYLQAVKRAGWAPVPATGQLIVDPGTGAKKTASFYQVHKTAIWVGGGLGMLLLGGLLTWALWPSSRTSG